MTSPSNLKRKLDELRNNSSSDAVVNPRDSMSMMETSDKHRAKRIRTEPDLDVKLSRNIDPQRHHDRALQKEHPQESFGEVESFSITNVSTTAKISKRAARRAIIANSGGDIGSNDKIKGTVRYTLEGNLEYLMSEVPETWVGAVYHNNIRGVLIEENNELGEYDHLPKRGLDAMDVTCYNAAQKSWGPNRADWPEALFNIYIDRTARPREKAKVWYYNGDVILDSDRRPMRAFDIPATISSQIEDFMLVAMIHSDLRLKLSDIRGRMPNVSRIATKTGERLENLKSLNALSMMMTRFRLKAALMPRENRLGSNEIEQALKKILPESCFESSPPSTRNFGRLLTDEEVSQLQKPNRGTFDSRKRPEIGDSRGKATNKAKSLGKKRKITPPQDLDVPLEEVGDDIDTVRSHKKACKGKGREISQIQFQGPNISQPCAGTGPTGQLPPFEDFNPDFACPRLNEFSSEFMADMEEMSILADAFPEYNPSELTENRTDQAFYNFLEFVPEPDMFDYSGLLQTDSNSLTQMDGNSRLATINDRPTNNWFYQGLMPEACRMACLQSPLQYPTSLVELGDQEDGLDLAKQTSPSTELFYNFSTGQYEPFEASNAALYGLMDVDSCLLDEYGYDDAIIPQHIWSTDDTFDPLYRGLGEQIAMDKFAINSNDERSLFLQSGNASWPLEDEVSNLDSANAYQNEQPDDKLPMEDEILRTVLVDFNDNNEYPSHSGYSPTKEWSFADFINSP